MHDRERAMLVFAAGIGALLLCLIPGPSAPRCETFGLYVACTDRVAGKLRLNVRNRSSRPLLLFKDRSAYRVEILGLGGYSPTAYDESRDTVQARARTTTRLRPDQYTLVAPGRSESLLLPAYGEDDATPLRPWINCQLELRDTAWATGSVPGNLSDYPLVDLAQSSPVAP